MSAEALNAALKFPRYSGGRRALLLVLAWRANDTRGHCIWMSKNELGKQAGLSARAVQRYLREFEADGIIALVGTEKGMANTYHFNVAALLGGEPQTPPRGEPQTPKGGSTHPTAGEPQTPLNKERHKKNTDRHIAPRPNFGGVKIRLPSVDDVRPAETTTFTKALAELDRTGRFASKTEAARHLMDLPSDEVDALAQGTAP